MERNRKPQTGRCQPESEIYPEPLKERVWRLFLNAKVLGYVSTFEGLCQTVGGWCGLTSDQVRYIIHNCSSTRKTLWR